MKKGKSLIKKLAFLFAMILTVATVVPEVMPASEVQAASLKLSHKGLSLTTGQRVTLSVKGTKKKARWKSSNSKVVTVDKKGSVRAVREGSATITATIGKKKLSCKVVVRGNYKALYKALLQKGSVVVKDGNYSHTEEMKSFLLLDIDKNGVPELITNSMQMNYGFLTCSVFTVRSGKVVYCGGYNEKGTSKLAYSSKYKAISVSWWTNGVGGAGLRLIRLSGTKLKEYKYMWTGAETYGGTKQIYLYGTDYKTAKKVSKSTFNKKTKKYNNSKKYSFTANTEYNRIKKLGR